MEMRKAHAYHGQDPYCGSCYAKEFKPVPCAGNCGGMTRSWHGETPGYCRTCRNKDRNCVRCGEHVARSHLRLPDGVACKRCRNFLAPPKPCSQCGKLSRRTSRDRGLGFEEPVCQTCRSKRLINCADCGKHRVQRGVNSDGRPICNRCAAGEVFICPVCNKEGKRLSARWCRECYYTELADRHCQQVQSTVTRPWVKKLTARFVEFLRERSAPNLNIVRMLQCHASFFALLDREFPRPMQLNTRALVACIGRDGLRQHQIIVGLLLTDGLLENLLESDVDDVAEEQARKKLLARIPEGWKAALLRKHEQYLMERAHAFRSRGWTGEHARFAPRTMTLSLRAAVRLLENLPPDVAAPSAIEQRHVDAFMAEKPGHARALHSFIMCLNASGQRFGQLEISRPSETQAPVHNFLSPETSNDLLRAWLSAEGPEARSAVAGLFMLLYARTAKQTVHLKLEDFLKGPDGIWRTRFASTWLALDPRLSTVLERHLAQRSRTDKDSPYLFVGRRPGSHLSTQVVSDFLKSYGVTAEKMFATSVINAYRNGVRYPKTLIKALGISTATAIRYWQQWDSRAAKVYAKAHQRA